MTSNTLHVSEQFEPEPRWPAFIAIVAVVGLCASLPPYLVMGPHKLLISLVMVLLIPTVITHVKDYHTLNRVLGFIISGVLTVGMISSLVLLISELPSHRETPAELLTSAAALWFTNVLVFALWYWRLDAGGPHGRDRIPGHQYGAFLFPQMMLPPDLKAKVGEHYWSPNFMDYLFLAFNTSTAFSPTDVPVLARWAKFLMMVQAILSLTVLALLAARAVNIL
jgi:hypothetical protein